MSATRPFAGHSQQHLLQWVIVSIVSMALSACTLTQPAPPPTVALNPSFSVVQQVDFFTGFGGEGDQQAVQDVAKALQTHSPQVCRDLEYECQSQVTVELFPDQNTFDRQGMNPMMQGYYAYSGNHRIQMVSPRNPTAGAEIPYSDRVLIAVHEFVHLVNNEINLKISHCG
jgi:hypothetical protein